MGLKTDAYSRFSITPTIFVDGQEVYGAWKRPELLQRKLQENEVIRYSVTKRVEGRPDLISQEIYGTTELDWVIIGYNNARSVLNWPKIGDTLVIPIPTLVSSELL